MSCAACSASVERIVKKQEGVLSCSVDLLSGRMVCEYDESKLTAERIIAAIEKIGFSASLYEEPKPVNKEETREKASGKAEKGSGDGEVKKRLIWSAVFLLPLMYVAMGHMWSLPLTDLFDREGWGPAFALTQFLLALPVIVLNRRYFTGGIKKLFYGAPNMDTLIAIGSGASFVYGIVMLYAICYAAAVGDHEAMHAYMHNLYFESAAMILVLVTFGKFLEERAKTRSRKASESLLDLSPKQATVLRNGEEVQIDAEQIVIGDILVIRPGEMIPADGEIMEGATSLNMASLTGESVPVEKQAGDKVLSSSLNIDGVIRVRAEKVGKETTLARIAKLVESAAASKAPVARIADKVSGIFVPVVIAIALVTFVVWMLSGEGIGLALNMAISVLVISCPCALGLATPVAITVAMGKSASNGVLIKSAEELERLHSTKTVIFDKTGTLTEGVMEVTDVIPQGSEAELLTLAASIEAGSSHPVASAVSRYCEGVSEEEKTDFRTIFGRGVTAVIGGKVSFAGNAELMNEQSIDCGEAVKTAEKLALQGKTVLYFASNGVFRGLIAVSDRIKKSAPEAVEALGKAGIESIMLTGDNRVTAEAIRTKVGIGRVHAECLPEDKEKIVSALQKQQGGTVMVGDGINDSPSLTAADVGVAIGEGTDIGIEAADIVLMRDDLRLIPQTIAFSKRVMRNIKQNLFWAFFYNVIGIPIAAGVLYLPFGIALSPMIGSLAMSFSSLFVVTNALRLYKGKDFES